MPRHPWKGVVGVGFPPAPVALSPEKRQDDIVLDDSNGGGFRVDDDGNGINELQERPYVILPDKGSDARITTSTHAVDIFAFVDAREIPFHCFQTPYFLAPAPGGERVYALLRETLRRSRKIGIAYVVIQMQRHLAALVPQGQSLILNTLRCENEADEPAPLPAWFEEADDAGLSEHELSLARKLIDSMTEQWDVLLQTDRLQEGGAEEMQTTDALQPVLSAAPEVICLEDMLDWADALSEAFGDDAAESSSPRPHRHFHAPASRRSGRARAAGSNQFRARPRRMN